MEELLKAIASHLEYFGYASTIDETVLKVSHPERATFWVIPFNEGVLFRTLFASSAAASEKSAELHAFLNRANSRCVVGRFTFIEQFKLLSVEAWFPNSYERKAFAAFFTRYVLEIATTATDDAVAVAEFFPPLPGSPGK